MGIIVSLHQLDARGGAQGSRYRRQDSDGEVDDFLPEFFCHEYKFKVMSFCICH